MTAKHTPTPWSVYHENGSMGSGGHYGVEAGDLPGRYTTIAVCSHGSASKQEQRANAAFIVRACNAHEDLCRCLREAVARVELENECGNTIMSAWANDARAALAKAEKS